MSSDRSLYDKQSYLVKTDEASKPLEHTLDINRQEACVVCGDSPNVTNHGDRTELESELLGVTRKLSKDPKDKYQKSAKIANTLNYSVPYLCERNLKNPKFRDQQGNDYIDELKKGITQKDFPLSGN
jgi:hypothetical protein